MCSKNGKIIFKNPNYPEQPKAGVYRWFFKYCNKEYTLYVGMSYKSTLLRGLQEITSNALSSDCGKSLDTDFIVRTCIEYIKNEEGKDLIWEHLDNYDMHDEIKCVKKYSPILQEKNGKIKGKIKCTEEQKYWIDKEENEAKECIYKIFSQMIKQNLT